MSAPATTPAPRTPSRFRSCGMTALATIVGAVAGAVLWALALSEGRWAELVDCWGLRNFLLIFPITGAAAGFLLASGLLWRGRKLLTPWSLSGALLGAVVLGNNASLDRLVRGTTYLESRRFNPTLAIIGCLLGFLLGLVVVALRRARMLRAVSSTRALILALIGAAPPALAVALACCLLLLATVLPVGGSGRYGPSATGQVSYQPRREPAAIFGWWAALSGTGVSVWALFCARRAAARGQEDSDLARSRRRRAVVIAILALLLNGGALPWLFREGWPSPIVPVEPAATSRTAPKGQSEPEEKKPAAPPGP